MGLHQARRAGEETILLRMCMGRDTLFERYEEEEGAANI